MAGVVNHHLPSDDLSKSMLDAFLRTGFTHHREILAYPDTLRKYNSQPYRSPQSL